MFSHHAPEKGAPAKGGPWNGAPVNGGPLNGGVLGGGLLLINVVPSICALAWRQADNDSGLGSTGLRSLRGGRGRAPGRDRPAIEAGCVGMQLECSSRLPG